MDRNSLREIIVLEFISFWSLVVSASVLKSISELSFISYELKVTAVS